MSAVPPKPDPSRCPLCGEANRCAMEVERETGQPQPPCWCMQADVRFGPELLARVPAATRGLACICARCAIATATATATADPDPVLAQAPANQD